LGGAVRDKVTRKKKKTVALNGREKRIGKKKSRRGFTRELRNLTSEEITIGGGREVQPGRKTAVGGNSKQPRLKCARREGVKLAGPSEKRNAPEKEGEKSGQVGKAQQGQIRDYQKSTKSTIRKEPQKEGLKGDKKRGRHAWGVRLEGLREDMSPSLLKRISGNYTRVPRRRRGQGGSAERGNQNRSHPICHTAWKGNFFNAANGERELQCSVAQWTTLGEKYEEKRQQSAGSVRGRQAGGATTNRKSRSPKKQSEF